MYVPSGGMAHRTHTRSQKMTTTDIRTRLFAAVFSIGVSAIFLATAIVPASPNGLVLA